MRTFKYRDNDLNFLAELLLYDFKVNEIRRRKGEFEVEGWGKLSADLYEEFEIGDIQRGLVVRGAARMYEEDPELVDPRYRFAKMGLPFD